MSGSGATAIEDSVVVKGCDATGAAAPVNALNSDVLPELGSPTRPSRSTAPTLMPGAGGVGGPADVG